MTKTGRKIGYGLAMFLSGLILLLSLAVIAGAWSFESTLANSMIEILDAVEKATGSLRQPIQRIDRNLEHMQSVSTQISTASTRLSQNVTDKGLIQYVFPEQQEQQLVALSSSVKEGFGNLHDTLAAGVYLYRSIDRAPFISLPAPSQEQVDQFEKSVAEIESLVDSLKKDVAAFRSGAGDQIGKVQTRADSLTSKLDQSRDQLANLDAKLAATQAGLIRLQGIVVNVILLVTALVTLLLAWVIYSQIAMLRLYKQCWKGLGTASRPDEQPDRNTGAENKNAIESGSLR